MEYRLQSMYNHMVGRAASFVFPFYFSLVSIHFRVNNLYTIVLAVLNNPKGRSHAKRQGPLKMWFSGEGRNASHNNFPPSRGDRQPWAWTFSPSMPHIIFFVFRQSWATTVRSSMPQHLSLPAVISFLDFKFRALKWKFLQSKKIL